MKLEYHKSLTSKAKDQSLVKERRTRFQLANLTKEERSFSYDRSFKSKLRRAKYKISSLSHRKDISFYLNISVPLVNISPIVFINIQASENLEAAQGMAKKFETVPLEEMLAPQRVFSPKSPKGYTSASPKPHKGEGQRLSSSHKRIWPEPRPPVASGDQAFGNDITLAEWYDLEHFLGRSDAIKFLESGLITATQPILQEIYKDLWLTVPKQEGIRWDFEEGAVT